MKTSLKHHILGFLRSKDGVWINGGEVEKFALMKGFKGSTASRLLRGMAEGGLIQREIKKGQGVASVWYMVKSRGYTDWIVNGESVGKVKTW